MKILSNLSLRKQNQLGHPAGPRLGINSLGTGLNPTQDIFAFYNFEEASGDAIDSIVPNNLTAVNAPGSGAGKILLARTTVTASAQAFTGNGTTFRTGTGSFSFTCWVNLTVANAFNPVITKGTVWDTNIDVAIQHRGDSGGLFSFILSNTSATRLSPVVAISAATWYFLGFVYDSVAQTLTARVNTTVLSGAFTAAAPNTTGTLQVGSNSLAGAGTLGGSIDALGYWKRALSTADLDYLYDSGTGRQYPL